MLSTTAIKEFQEIYRQEYGEEISDAEVLELGVSLLTIMNVVYRPIKKEWVLPELDSR